MPADLHVGHCHSAVFIAPYGHCQSEVFSAPYGHCLSGVFSVPYHRSAVEMNVPVLVQPHIKPMQQPVTPAISTLCCIQDPTVNVNLH